jgi:acyl carrier protein
MINDIESRAIQLAAEQAGVEPTSVTPEHRFVEDLNFDSLDLVEFAMSVEDAFDLSLPDEQFADIKAVREAIDLVKEHLKSAPAAA